MTPSHTSKNGRRYRYYTCGHAQKVGWAACPTKSVPAAQVEKFVVQQIRAIGKDHEVVTRTMEQVASHREARLGEIDAERRGLERDLGYWAKEVQGEVKKNGHGNVARLADLQERIRLGEARAAELSAEEESLEVGVVDPDTVEEALARFDPVWEAMTQHEQARLVQMLVQQVTLDGAKGKMSITLQPTGLAALAGALQEAV